MRECDDKDVVIQQKVAILKRNNYIVTHIAILDVVFMKLDTILICFIELVDS
jgi:hypothetical protein